MYVGVLTACMHVCACMQAGSSQDEWVRSVAASVGDCSGRLSMAALSDSFPLVRAVLRPCVL